jgi:glycosyltransferase involved in cell wall biosynthesis
MKIAQIVCAFPPYSGGIGNSAYDDQIILTKQWQLETFYPEKKPGPYLRYGHGAFWPSLLKKLKKFDLIFLHYPFFGTAEIVYLFKLLHPRTPLIIHYHMDVKNFSWLTKLLSLPGLALRNKVLKKADKIICASLDYIKESQIKNFYQKNKGKFIEIPFGVKIDEFQPNLKFEKNGQRILFVGGLDKAHYFKGLDLLLSSLAGIKQNFELNIVGTGDLEIYYQQQSQKLGLNSQVNFLGKLNGANLQKMYQESDFFVLPSINRNEAFGLVLIEALASGLPVIASRLPGVRTVFIDNQEGLYFTPNSKDDLQLAIEKMLDLERQKYMSIKARQLALSKYNQTDMAKKIISLFSQYENLSN